MEQEFRSKRIPPFSSRATVIAAANMIKAEGHAGFEALRLEYDLQSTDAGKGGGLAACATSLATYALANPDVRTPEGIPLQSAIVARAGDIYRSGTRNNIDEKVREAFKAASSQGGAMNDVTEAGEDSYSTLSVPAASELQPLMRDQHFNSSGPHLQPKMRELKRKIFIVHGHDDAARLAVARYLERLGFEAIVLHEQANRGGTIIEKFEANSDVGFAVVLLTPDDAGSKPGQPLTERARQNVILEWGFFIGKLGRAHVMALKKGNVELPSDIHGLVWEPFDEHEAWRMKLAKELAAVGFDIDWQKVAT